jgi:hypothetical protein
MGLQRQKWKLLKVIYVYGCCRNKLNNCRMRGEATTVEFLAGDKEEGKE